MFILVFKKKIFVPKHDKYYHNVSKKFKNSLPDGVGWEFILFVFEYDYFMMLFLKVAL